MRVTIKKSNCIIFALIECSPTPLISVSVVLSNQLDLCAYKENIEVSKLKSHSFPKNVGNLCEIESVLSDVKSLSKENTMEPFSVILDNLRKVDFEDEAKQNTLKFLMEQFELLVVNSPERLKYSCNMSVFSWLLHSISTHCYKFIRSSKKFKFAPPENT